MRLRTEKSQIVAVVGARTTPIDYLEAELDRQIIRLCQSTSSVAFVGNTLNRS